MTSSVGGSLRQHGAHIVQKNLLHDEGSDCLGQLAAHLHSAKTQWNNLCGQQEVDDLCVIHLQQADCQLKGREGASLPRCLQPERSTVVQSGQCSAGQSGIGLR